MKKTMMMVALLACGSALAGPDDGAAAIEAVGYDVASDLLVIHGRNLSDGSSRMPEVRVGGVVARVVSHSGLLITAQALANTGPGIHEVTVGHEDRAVGGELVLAIQVPLAPPAELAGSSVTARD
jgi:hypothetical protein